MFANASNASDRVSVTITDGSTVYGVVYAPGNLQVTLADSTLFGSVVARDLPVTDSTVHYDRAVRTLVVETGVVNRINFLHITTTGRESSGSERGRNGTHPVATWSPQRVTKWRIESEHRPNSVQTSAHS